MRPSFQRCDNSSLMIELADFSLTNARVLRPDDRVETGAVHVSAGRLIDDASVSGADFDCQGLYVLPGIIDVHGDAFERELHPRPGVEIAFDIAMTSVDKQLIANGITTTFHGLTLSWEPGERSRDAGVRFMQSLSEHRTTFVSDHRVQLRWETFADDSVEDVIGWMQGEVPVVLAFNDHTTSTLRKVAAGEHKKLHQWASRAGMTPEEYLLAVGRAAERAPEVPALIERIAATAKASGTVMLSHDDRTVEDREHFARLGVDVCEFPLTEEAARHAIDAGTPTVLGGPNVIRGGSHTGALSAEAAVRDGLCSVLASDYYYPSLFHAALKLIRSGALDIAAAWALISGNPAKAMKLTDRGEIAPGQRADLVIADLEGGRGIVGTVAAGRLCWFG
jgi:alpha-D-ribose 1-methylphosphonate 5-triphosphate diphosphatase